MKPRHLLAAGDLFSMPAPTPSRPMIVDSFAGGGGASTGIEMALGRSPDIAINHSAAALAVHALNHPDTLHLSENIWQVDPLDAVGHRPVGLAWFSPDCKHFSKAKGGKPVKRSVRDLAWTVVLWAKRARPSVIILENVEEFATWGPLVETRPEHWTPCPKREGETFARWVSELRRLGYKVEWRELVAADFGAPTTRKRLFVIARRDGRPIVWPKPTHGPGRAQPWRTAADVIDWSLPCPSIFATSEEIWAEHGIRAQRPLAEATLRRIEAGLARFVRDNPRPFVVRRPGDERLVAAFLAQHNGDTKPSGLSYPKPGRPLDAPLSTLTTSGSQQSLVCAFLVKYYGSAVGHGVDEPMHTVTTRDRFGLVTVTIDGETFAVADVGMRMLTVNEMFAAQGFPAGYRTDALVDDRPIPRAAQVACAGNSVCPPLAAALVGANCDHLVEAGVERIAA